MNSYFKIIRSFLFLVSFISVITSCKKDAFDLIFLKEMK
jgi:hypothetical protein